MTSPSSAEIITSRCKILVSFKEAEIALIILLEHAFAQLTI